MKKAKKLYILTGVFLLICLMTYFVSKQEEQKEKIKNSDEIILKIDKSNVKKLSWEVGSTKLSFQKKDGKWIYEEDENFPVNNEKIENLLEQFESFGVSFEIEQVEDYGQYGLENPAGTIQIQTKDEKYEVSIGDFSNMDSERYVSIGDGNAYLVKEDPLDAFSIELKDLIKNDEIPDLSKTKEIQFEGTEEEQIVYEEESPKTYCSDDVFFLQDGSKQQPLDTMRVEAYLDLVTNLNFGQYMTYHATEEELKTYGLDQPDLTMMMEYEVQEKENDEAAKDSDNQKVEASEFVLHIARDPQEKKEADSKASEEEEEITAYARVGDSGIVYKIGGEDYEALMKASYNDLRHQKVFTADSDKIQSVDIALDGKNYTLTTKKENDELVWYYNEKKINGDDFKTALYGLETAKFTDEQPSEKEEISLTVQLDNENYPEVTVELYRFNGNNCLAVLDGEPVALVAREHVVELVEAVNGIVLE